VDPGEARENLQKIEHIVVLMMENRSFDHMLGYLGLPEGDEFRGRGRTDVEGLSRDHGNCDESGEFLKVERLAARRIDEKVLDPGHGAADVDAQLAKDRHKDREIDNGGFVKNYQHVLRRHRRKLLEEHGGVPPWRDDLDFEEARKLVLGYQTAEEVPVYDFLAEEFTICDRWFSSVPGATWPNRLYALTGGPDKKGSRDGKGLPVYRRRSWVRELERRKIKFRWYSSDPGTLRLVDRWYRLGPDDAFAFLAHRSLLEAWNFFDDVAQRNLPQLAWVDPNFVDLGGLWGANDDHPPSDVLAGQELVLRVYNAIAKSDYYWPRTLLVIFYDEHGGFYDHLVPPGTPEATDAGDPPADDRPKLRRYGVRVPAFVVSPYAKRRHVAKADYDHTSVIATVLRTLCPGDADRIMSRMNSRVRGARDLRDLLDGPLRDPPEVPATAYDRIIGWHKDAYSTELRNPLRVKPPWSLEDEALKKLRGFLRRQRERLLRIVPTRRLFAGLLWPEKTRLRDPHDLEAQMFAFSKSIRKRGLPPGKP
jgi:phospholipase C